MLNNSKELKSEAERILSDWDLLNFLNKYGNTYVVGSVVLDLMVWRDIDIEIISDNTPTKDEAIEIAKYLFNLEGVRKVSPIDYRDSDNPQKPKGLYIGAEYIDKDKNSWKVDVWYLTKDSANSKNKTDEILSKLNDENRKKIMDIKSQFYANPNYRINVTGVDIYEAVLEKGINNPDEFKKYIKDTKGLLL